MWLLSTNQSLWYVFGPQGETRLLFGNTGAVADSYTYSPYGVLLASTGTDANPFRYGGQAGYYTDANNRTGAILCGLRWYNPALGRWLSRDPIGYFGGPNLYEYCGSNPIMGLDPTGTDGDGIQFLIGEAKGFWNFATDFTTPVILGRQFTGNKDFGKILPTNSDQEDGDTFGTALTFVGSLFFGGGANAARVSVASGQGSETATMQIVRYINKGEKVADIVNEVKVLTYSNRIEHAVVKLKNGKRAIVCGGHTGINFPAGSIQRLLGHSHPYDLPAHGPSPQDRAALKSLGQNSSYLIEHGILEKFFRK